jgi:hypothetical protein
VGDNIPVRETRDHVGSEAIVSIRFPLDQSTRVRAPEENMVCAMKIGKDGGRMFMCGSGLELCKICGWVADVLCDYPMGKGKTCDIQLCSNCAFEVGDDFHLCPVHKAEFSSKAKINKVALKGNLKSVK